MVENHQLPVLSYKLWHVLRYIYTKRQGIIVTSTKFLWRRKICWNRNLSGVVKFHIIVFMDHITEFRLYSYQFSNFSQFSSDRNVPSPGMFSNREHSLFTEFVRAVWFALIANTETMCYLIVFLNAIGSRNENLLFVPLLVFLWATLSIPRPSKLFWITIIVISKVRHSARAKIDLKIMEAISLSHTHR